MLLLVKLLYHINRNSKTADVYFFFCPCWYTRVHVSTHGGLRLIPGVTLHYYTLVIEALPLHQTHSRSTLTLLSQFALGLTCLSFQV